MKRVGLAGALLVGIQASAFGRGVTPYLPLNLEPEIESQIERVLILGDKPVLKRPIPAATVLDALPKACQVDEALCERVRRYLARFTHDSGITHASIGGAASSGSGKNTVAPNRYGMTENSHWELSGQAYWQPNDYVLVDAGINAYQGKTDFTGSLVSLGFDLAQLDIGFRPHWFSPMTDSSLLMSTEAPTMPSVTLSNYKPLGPLGMHYELFAARMSESTHIVYNGGYTRGHPRLAGFHLQMEPTSGWSLGVSRLLQYGGGALNGSSLHDLYRAFFNPSAAQTVTTNNSQVFGNQEASFTSNFIFPGRIPFAVYFEYAGEDTSKGKNYLLGNTALSAGIHFPRLWQRFDLTLEATEWQNLWYVHSVYLDGMTNYGRVTGNWFGDQRVFFDAVGGRSAMINIGWEAPFGGHFQLRYRTLQNEQYGVYHYDRYQQLTLGYSRQVQGVLVGGEVDGGRDVFGGRFTRLEGFVRYDPNSSGLTTLLAETVGGAEPLVKNGELFIDAGANQSKESASLTANVPRVISPARYGYHFAIGARRSVSEHSDLGARVEVDEAQSHSLIGVRALDYRYRFDNPLALSFFLGAARYALATPAYGIYLGAGAQWRNVLSGWDLGVDFRYAYNIQRDHVLPNDPPNVGERNDSFYNLVTPTVYISRHF